MNLNHWFKIIMILLSFILLIIGFLIGYSYGDKSCYDNPLIYGIKQLNEKYDEDIFCSCTAPKGNIKSFTVNQEEMKSEGLFSTNKVIYNYSQEIDFSKIEIKN